MLDLELEGCFRRDLKRVARRHWKRESLDEIVNLLRREAMLPENCRPHKLSGDWMGYWDCHVGPDWILIYKVTRDALRLARTGTHADLFE